MKKLLIIGAVISSLTLSSFSQEVPPVTPNPVSKFVDFFSPLLTATNWAVAGYGLINQDTYKVGGGIGALYNISDYAGMWIRGEYNGTQFTGGSGSLTLQLPIPIAGGKAVLMPFAYTGAGTVFGGLGERNGQLQGIVGAGTAVKYKNFSVFTSYEKRSNDSDYLLAGLIYKF